MALKKRTKIILISIVIILVILSSTLCYFFLPRRIYSLLPDEEIIAIRMTYGFNSLEYAQPMDKDKTKEFMEVLKDIKFTIDYERHNYRYVEEPGISFVITYPSCSIEFNTVFVSVYNKDKGKKYFKVLEMFPMDKFQQLRKIHMGQSD